MLKLKQVIRQLDASTYESVENKLLKTKADNFLQLLRAYRSGEPEDSELAKNMGLVPNSFYVLKSRLYDRIQAALTSDLNLLDQDVFSQLSLVHHVCYDLPNETAVAFLLKLEKNLLVYDMHGELLIVYSALKKLHYHTDKYFYYSQLHNKHVAFWLSLEKAEDSLSDFNLLLEQYDFSKTPENISKLKFLRSEIQNHSALNTSKQLRVIKNLMDIQLLLFCDVVNQDVSDIGEVLKETTGYIQQLSNSSRQKKWEIVLDYLSFEYYNRTGQLTKAKEYYEKTNQVGNKLFSFSNVALVSNFFISKIEFLAAGNNLQSLEIVETALLNKGNLYSAIQIGLYNAMTFYYSQAIKKGIQTLNTLLTLFSLKGNFHIVMEIKFTLAYFYLKSNDIAMAESLTISVSRKIKSDKLIQYQNALDLIRFFGTYYSAPSHSTETKRQDLLLLFRARNSGEVKLLRHLQYELRPNQ